MSILNHCVDLFDDVVVVFVDVLNGYCCSAADYVMFAAVAVNCCVYFDFAGFGTQLLQQQLSLAVEIRFGYYLPMDLYYSKNK